MTAVVLFVDQIGKFRSLPFEAPTEFAAAVIWPKVTTDRYHTNGTGWESVTCAHTASISDDNSDRSVRVYALTLL